MGIIGLNQFVQKIGWEKVKEIGSDKMLPTAWETILASLVAYGATIVLVMARKKGERLVYNIIQFKILYTQRTHCVRASGQLFGLKRYTTVRAAA
jgi:hypothetical protein